MTFLAPFLLWFLAAASVPVIIHLLNKRRHKTIQWAAMQFLLRATRESRGKKKIRHILILTCRALGIAALAFAAARPIVSGLLGWGAGTIDSVVLILDRSASMELRPSDGTAPKRELVLQKVRDAMRELGSPRLVLIDSVSGKPQEISSSDVLPDISSTAPSDSQANFPTLLNTAVEVLSGSTGRSEVWLASDLQSSNWQPTSERWAAVRASLAALDHKPTLRLLTLTASESANSALRMLGTRRTPEGLTLDLELLRSEKSRGTLTLPLTTSLAGARTTSSITVPGQSLIFQKQITIPDETKPGHGWLSIPADGNPRDNTVFFAFGPARPVKTLIVAPAGEAADYLALAAAPPGFEKQTSARIDPAIFASTSISEAALILWAAPLPSGKNSEILSSFLASGGQLIFLPTPEPSPGDFLGMKWLPNSLAQPGKFFILGEWNKADGPLRNGLDGVQIPAERLRAIKRAVPEGDAAVLARWEDGEAFITRKIVDRGTLWFLGSIPDYKWSNLGDADVLLPAIQRILTLGADRFDSSFLAEVGSAQAATVLGTASSRIDDFSTTSSPGSAGVFRNADRILALNRPLAEDDPEIAGKDQLDRMLEGTNYRLLDQAGTAADPSLSTDVWRAFFVAVLFFLLAEALLCLPKKSASPASAPSTKPASSG